MGLMFAPVFPWSYLAATALGLLLAAYALHVLIRRWRGLAEKRDRRIAVGTFTMLAGVLLLAAVLNPVSSPPPQESSNSIHVAVVLDVSESVLRGEGWQRLQPVVRTAVQTGVNALDDESRSAGSASLITFRGGTTTRDLALADLLNGFDQLSPSDFAPGEGSDIGAGIRVALSAVRDHGGRGLILLVSDGHDTGGGMSEAVAQAARTGIPVWTIPFGSTAPEAGFSAAYLPPEVIDGEAALMRGMLINQGPSEIPFDIELIQNPGAVADGGNGGMRQSSERVTLPPGSYASVRQPVIFSGLGLQPFDAIIRDRSGQPTQQRRFYTHITRPLRILAVGGDFSWVSAIRPEFAAVDQIHAANLNTVPDLTVYDSLVLSAVSAEQLLAADIERIVIAVRDRGVGLMLFNGTHQGAAPEAETVLRSYAGTALDPLLPLSTEPRPFTPEPPPRQIVLLLDISGSMSGWPLEKEKQIAAFLITEEMRPQDRLDIILFDTRPVHLVADMAMDAQGQQTALSRLSQVGIGGGTDPTTALQLVAGRQFTNCGLFFMSDGGFNANVSRLRPDCRVSAFEIGSTQVWPGSPLYQLADPFAVPYDFDPATIEIPYFEVQQRDRFFEPGDFVPLSMEAVTGVRGARIPELSLDGSAIAFLCDARLAADPSCASKLTLSTAYVAAVRPKWVDALLAYGIAGQGTVGEFSSGLNSGWLNSVEGRDALESWLMQTVAYAARDRYVFRAEDEGERFRVELSLKAQDGLLPNVTALSAMLRVDGEVRPMTVTTVPDAPSAFVIEGIIPRTAIARQASLEILEFGPDALGQPQRVPLIIAPALANSGMSPEAAHYGVDELALKDAAALTGGVYNPSNELWTIPRVDSALPTQSYWMYFALLALAAYLTAIALRRL